MKSLRAAFRRFVLLAVAAVVLGSATASAQISAPANRFDLTATLPRAGNSVATADLNGDGHLDVVIAQETNVANGEINVLLGDGAGSFIPHWQASGPAHALKIGDFDGDGATDLATLSGAPDVDGHLTIRLGNGDGTFAAPTAYPVRQMPLDTAFGDVNGDGHTDAIVANSWSHSISILHGNGDGTFAPAINRGATRSPSAVVAADFDGDGDVDIAVASFNAYVTLFMNTGGGALVGIADLGVQNTTDHLTSLAAADLNNDGWLDLVTTYAFSGQVGVRFGTGLYHFTAETRYANDQARMSVAADIDLDGDRDLIIGGLWGVYVMVNEGNGAFAPSLPQAGYEYLSDLALGEFNGDGRADLIAVSWNPAALLFGRFVDSQTIDFAPIGDRQFGDAPIALSAAASSGLPVEFAVTGPATLDGTTLTLDSIGTVTVTVTQAGNNAFAPASASQTFEVTRRPAVVSWPVPATIAYGTVLDGTQLNATADVDGTLTFDPPAGTLLNAGQHQLGVHFTPTSANYADTYVAVPLTVERAVPAVTWGELEDIVYGTPISGAQLNAVANVPGAFFYDVTDGTILPAGRERIRLQFVPDDSTNYATILVDRFVNVLRATPTVSWPSPADITYGTPLGAAQLNATATVNGVFTYEPPAATVLDGGTHTLTVTFRPFSDSYESVSRTSTIVVRTATPVITWQPFWPMANRTALGPSQLNASANVPGTFEYDPPAGTIMPGGTHQLQVTFTPANLANHVVVHETRSITVSRVTPQVSWIVAPMIAGDSLGTAQLGATANVPGTFIYSESLGAQFPFAGTHLVTLLFDPADAINYERVQLERQLVVTHATPAITWNPAPTTFGAPLTVAQLNAASPVAGTFIYNPPLGGVPTGILNSDPLEMQLTATFVPSDPRIYRTVEQIRVAVSVAKADVQIAWAAPAAITYGEPLSAAQRTAVSSIQGAIGAPVLIYTPPTGTLLDAGTHTLTVRSQETQFYREATATVQIEVRPRLVTMSWSTPAPIEYGTRLNQLQLNATAASGLPGISVPIQYNPPPGTRLPAGTHTLTASVGSANFEAPSVSVELAIARAALLVFPSDTGRDYYTPQPATIPVDPQYGVAGLKDGDVVGVSLITTAVDGSPAGDYPLTPVFSDPLGVIGNYIVTSLPNTYTVYNPFAYVESLGPNVVVRGSGDTEIVVRGDGFLSGVTELRVNGDLLPYTFVSRYELRSVLSAALFAERGLRYLTTSNDSSYYLGYGKELFVVDAPTTVGSVISAQGYGADYPLQLELGDGVNPSTLFFESLGDGTVTLARFSVNPGPPNTGAGFFGLTFWSGSAFTSATITTCDLGADGRRVSFFDGTTWAPVPNQLFIDGSPSCIRAVIDPTTVPGIGDLTTVYFATTAEAADHAGPDITLHATPDQLWPATGAMVPVTLSGVIHDVNAIGTASVHVVDEYGSVEPSASIVVAADGRYSVTILLEAGRHSTDTDGRRYTVRIDAADEAGNASSASTVVPVPYFVDGSVEGRIRGDVRLSDGSTYYDVSINAKEASGTGELGHFAMKRVTPARTDRFVSDGVAGVSFMRGSGSFVDSVIYIGTGKWNGQPGYRFEAHVIDRGDPGPGMDQVRFSIVDSSGVIVATFDGLVTMWNIQSATY